jgi:hypothetical protein
MLILDFNYEKFTSSCNPYWFFVQLWRSI